MVKITYREFSGSGVMSLRAEGHAGFADKGRDVVCAAVSALMQTLAYSVDDDRRSGACCYEDGPNGPILTVQAKDSAENRAKFELMKEGAYLLSESYPEYVQFIDLRTTENTGAMDLQLFGEDGAGDGSAGSESSAVGAAPAPELPKLRPAEERLARRSGVLKRTAQGTEGNGPLSHAARDSSPKEGSLWQDGKQNQTTQANADAEGAEKPENGTPAEEKDGGKGEGKEAEKAASSPEEHRRAFGELMKGEYAEEFTEAMQRAAEAASQKMMEDPALKGLLGALAEAYGTDAGDLNALTEAVKNGRVKDEAYYEQLAMEKGISIKTAKEMDKLESQNRKLTAAQQLAQQQQQAAQRQAEMEAIHAKWDREAEVLRQQYPGFDLHETLNNPDVSDLMRRGVSLSNAYRAIYFDRLMADATAQTAKQTEQGVLARVQQRNARPGENGTRPSGAVQTRLDINSMTRKEREALERRVLRGEKITFTT